MSSAPFVRTFVAALALSWLATTSARADALSPESAARAQAVPSERTPQTGQHYVLSNEWRQDLLRAPLAQRHGAYLGVGADQNYTMAALAGSEMLWLVDFDRTIPLVHKMYGVLVPASATPDELVARFADDSEASTIALLREKLAADRDARRVVRLYRAQRRKLHRYLARVRALSHQVSWLADPALYAHVRRLHVEGRVVSRTGDLTGTSTVQAVARAARELGQCFGVLYFSNAEQFFEYDASFVANIDALPRCEGATLVRSFTHARIPRAADDDWSYMTHELADFVERIHGPYRRSFTIVGDVYLAKAPFLGKDGHSYATRDTPRPFVARAEARKAARKKRNAEARRLAAQ